MTKRHFEAIAKILREEIEGADAYRDANVAESAVRDVAERLAEFFAGENPRFDEARFLTAAGAA